MADQELRFTGEDLVILVTPTGGSELTLNTHYSAFSFGGKIDNVDVTAGNEVEKFKLVTKEDMTWSIDVWEGDFDTWDEFTTVKTGVMVVRPLGTGDGLPEFSFNYILEGHDHATGTDKAATLTCSGSRVGAMIIDFGGVQGAVRHLAFTTQPTNTASAAKIASVIVTVRDPSNATVTTDNSTVITLDDDGTTVASGVLSVRVINGVASFPGIVVTGTHTGSTLVATNDKGYTGATSSTFNVT